MRYIKTGAKIEQIKLYCVEADCGDFSKEKWRLGAFTNLKKAKEFIKSQFFKKGERVSFEYQKLGGILQVINYKYRENVIKDGIFEYVNVKKLRIRLSRDFLILRDDEVSKRAANDGIVFEMKEPCFLSEVVKLN